MKREFLQNLKVEGVPLPKEIVDAIMGENGKDIEATKGNYADYEALKTELSQANDTIAQLQALDAEGLRQAARDWEEKYNTAVETHSAELSELRFSHTLDKAISKAKGRSAKAITALLDLETLKNSQDPEEDIAKALESLKEESAYLFHPEITPPPFARGTGAYAGAEERSPATLAGALRERFENERK